VLSVLSARLQTLTRPPSSSTVLPATGDCASPPWFTLRRRRHPWRQLPSPSSPLSSVLQQYKAQRPAHLREQHFPSTQSGFLFYSYFFLSLLSLPTDCSLFPCRGSTTALLECIWAALAGSALGQAARATRLPIQGPSAFWSRHGNTESVLYVVCTIRQPVSIIDRDCGASYVSPPTWDLEGLPNCGFLLLKFPAGARRTIRWALSSRFLDIRPRDLSHRQLVNSVTGPPACVWALTKH
jgi:hypothetical protein